VEGYWLGIAVVMVGLYARVSTEDKDQNPENQLVILRKYATSKAWEWKEYIDFESGKAIEITKRQQFIRMFLALRNNELDGILVLRPDRFSREPRDALNYIHDVIKLDKFLYIVDRDKLVNRKIKKVELAMLGFEQQANYLESALLSDRIKDAYNRKKDEAESNHVRIRWGKKPMMARRLVTETSNDGSTKEKWVYDVPIDKTKVLELRTNGMTIRDIAEQLGCSTKPIMNIIKEMNTGTQGLGA